MPSNSLDRFKKRQKLKNSISVYANEIGNDEVNEFLNSNCNTDKVNSVYKATKEFYDISVSEEEAKEFLEKFKTDFNQARFDKLISDCKKDVINSIITPFGLGHIVAAYDKTGGNVTTVHNANQNIYANDEDKYNRKDYTNTKNSENKQFAGDSKNSVGSTFTKSKMDDNGNVTDAYTGKTQKADTTSPDHINSLSQYHKDGGFMQDKTRRADFGTDENNLALTDRSINTSMRDFDKEDWMGKETNGNQKNKDRFEIDEDKLKREIQKGKETAKEHLPTNTEKAKYYTKNATTTGVGEGAKMGVQQAIGLVMTEFFTALFDEILDIYKNGFSAGFDDDRFFSVLKERLKTIAKKLKVKWKEVAIVFKDGFISGFISNLVTTVINAFVTTGKRIVRIIREGIFSLFKAIKIILFPPENLTYEEAMHEAKKLIATGLIVSLGVIIEEYVDVFIKSTTILAPFAGTLSAIFVGAITGLAITMTVYYMDKKKNDKDAVKMLITQTDESFDNIDSMLNSVRKVQDNENSNLIVQLLYLKS
jgi:hypothetical protein